MAPVTVLTALFIYFGSVRTSAYFGYFGISQEMLQLSAQEYVLRSATVTAGAVARLALVGAVLLTLDRLLIFVLTKEGASSTSGGLRRRMVAWTAVVIGAASVLLGLLIAVSGRVAVALGPTTGAALLAVGAVVFLRFGAAIVGRRNTRRGPISWLVAIALLVAGFWAASLYADGVGTTAAQGTDVEIGRLPLVTVFSNEPLDLPGRDVVASRVEVAPQQFRYRYTGLSLLTYANDRWFVITGRLDDTYRPSVSVLRDADSVRIEVAVSR